MKQNKTKGNIERTKNRIATMNQLCVIDGGGGTGEYRISVDGMASADELVAAYRESLAAIGCDEHFHLVHSRDAGAELYAHLLHSTD